MTECDNNLKPNNDFEIETEELEIKEEIDFYSNDNEEKYSKEMVRTECFDFQDDLNTYCDKDGFYHQKKNSGLKKKAYCTLDSSRQDVDKTFALTEENPSTSVAVDCHDSFELDREQSPAVLSIEERVFLIEHVFRDSLNYTTKVKDQFSQRFPNTPVPRWNTVEELIRKFRESGSVADAPRSARPTLLTDVKKDQISNVMFRNPSQSIHRKWSEQTNMSAFTGHTDFNIKLSPYKISAVHELRASDYTERVRYCEWFKDFIDLNGEDVLDVTFYTSDAWFHLSGFINSPNTRLWTSETPHEVHETPLHGQKIGVWIGLSRARVIGPIFFDQVITPDLYCSEILFPFIAELNEEEINNAYFQQDDRNSHTASRPMDLLNEVFGDRIISKGVWPPRSPDLTPSDYFFWEAAMSKVYENNPITINELKAAIISYTHSITRDDLIKVFNNKIKRVDACIESKGAHFQHFL